MPRGPLAQTQYHELLRSHLVPMLAGCELEPAPLPCDLAEDMVVLAAAGDLLIRPDPVWPRCFRLRRRHPFDADDIKLAEQFVRALGEKLAAAAESFFRYLVEKCPEEVVASSVQHRAIDDALLPGVIGALRRWASQTYEGARISVAIGVNPRPEPARISSTHLNQLLEQDFAKVLSNGMDTLVVLSPSGHVVEHRALMEETREATRIAEPAFTPNRYLPLARWARSGRVAVALNRQGEILVFSGQRLQFALRRGTWFHLAHRAMIARMGGTKGQERLMRAVYASALDVSFARTGGCIAVAKIEKADSILEYLNRDDVLALATKPKSALLNHLVGRPFDRLPRAMREEMAAIDGAVVLDAAGLVVAAGAIVRVRGGSEGGGRRAAAKALSRLGLAVKISQDGGMTAFTDRGTKDKPEIAFEACV